jgi:hypothetical protein
MHLKPAATTFSATPLPSLPIHKGKNGCTENLFCETEDR